MLKLLLNDDKPIDSNLTSKSLVQYQRSPIVLSQISSKSFFISLYQFCVVAKAFEKLSNGLDSDRNPKRRISNLTPTSKWPPKEEIKSLKSQIEQTLNKKIAAKKPQNQLKRIVRRKSCYCQDCGGISKFELKTKGIVFENEK